MEELKLNPESIRLSLNRLNNCISRVNGAIGVLDILMRTTIFKRRLKKLCDEYCDVRKVLKSWEIFILKTKTLVAYNGKYIESGDEYKRCLQNFKEAFEAVNMKDNYIEEVIEELLTTLDTALEMESN